jgi:putative FmdB family regulatory protein
MPIYEFGCKSCRRRFEKIVPPGRTPAAAACPRCGARAARLPSRFAVAGTTAKSAGGDDWGKDLGDADEGGDDLAEDGSGEASFDDGGSFDD